MEKASVTIEDKEVRAFIRRVLYNLARMGENKDSEFISAMSTIVFKDVMDHFDKQMGSDGPWPTWSPFYRRLIRGWNWFDEEGNLRGGRAKGKPPANERPRKGKISGKLLQDTGHLKNNFKPGSWRANAREIVWYNNAQTPEGVPYAWAHNYGKKVRSHGKSVQMPQREFMWLSDEAFGKIPKIAIDFMLRGAE